MSILTCKKLRSVVVSSMILFAAGMLLQIPAVLLKANLGITFAALSYAGLMAMLISMAVMLLTALISLLPTVSEQLRTCQH